MSPSRTSRFRAPAIGALAVVCLVAIGCGPRLTADVVTESVLASPPFDGALAVIVPRSLAAPCRKLPASAQSYAWGVLVNSGFMSTSATRADDGSESCTLSLTQRGAARRSFGRIVPEGDSWRVPVGGIGTDLPEYDQSGSGDTITVTFDWQFYRFRGVEGLLLLDGLEQSNKSVRAASVPARGVASAIFRRDESSWKLEGLRLLQ